MQFIDNQDRDILCEGRDYGMGFAFCRKDGDIVETVHPISPCKDYLNDVVAAETLDITVEVYGLRYQKLGIFNEDPIIAFKIFNGYSGFEKDTENLNNNYKNLQLFINRIEEKLGIPASVIEKVDDCFLITFSKKWLCGIYAISMFSLLLRLGQWYNPEVDVFEYLEKYNYISDDVYMCSGMLPKLKKFIENRGLKDDDFGKYGGSYNIHNNGILSYEYC